MSFKNVALLSMLFCLTACAGHPIRTSPTDAGEQRLHSDFLEAHKRMGEPYILAGEDVERLSLSFRDQLRQLGDERFAAALSKEPSDVIAAVRGFIDFTSLNGEFPRTRRICSDAPKIEFPAEKITKEDQKRE